MLESEGAAGGRRLIDGDRLEGVTFAEDDLTVNRHEVRRGKSREADGTVVDGLLRQVVTRALDFEGDLVGAALGHGDGESLRPGAVPSGTRHHKQQSCNDFL